VPHLDADGRLDLRPIRGHLVAGDEATILRHGRDDILCLLAEVELLRTEIEECRTQLRELRQQVEAPADPP
jgi:hypothetical protein